MHKTYHKSVFIFRRDLRLEDNLGLLQTLDQSEQVIPVFIFDPRQIDRSQNEFFSEPAFQFLLESLRELDQDLQNRGSKLYVYEGEQHSVIETLIKNEEIDFVACNKDYTPFARKRDKAIADVCEKASVVFVRFDDLTLSPIETIRTGQDKLYTVFTPFMKNAAKHTVTEPQKNNYSNYYTQNTTTNQVQLESYTAEIGDRELVLRGGRTAALQILNDQATYLSDYSDTRNIPAVKGTSRLSPHHKFGTISIRETFYSTKEFRGNTDSFISELYWRDFYYYIAYYFPIVFQKSFLPWAGHLEWINDESQFEAWCKGVTGVPMVDAAMRELNHTGWMHNRSRMVVASYLTKNLLINWQWGEKYFAKQLTDYDPAQNNGGWQWSASTGADPRPLRIFNPYTQAQKFDADTIYIKHWIPELQNVEDKLLTDGKTQDFGLFAPEYPSPIVDQKESYHRTMATYKAAKEAWKATQESSTT